MVRADAASKAQKVTELRPSPRGGRRPGRRRRLPRTRRIDRIARRASTKTMHGQGTRAGAEPLSHRWYDRGVAAGVVDIVDDGPSTPRRWRARRQGRRAGHEASSLGRSHPRDRRTDLRVHGAHIWETSAVRRRRRQRRRERTSQERDVADAQHQLSHTRRGLGPVYRPRVGVSVTYAVGGPESEEASTSTTTHGARNVFVGLATRRRSVSAMKPWKHVYALSLSAMPTLLSAHGESRCAELVVEPGTSRDQAGACKRCPGGRDSQVIQIQIKLIQAQRPQVPGWGDWEGTVPSTTAPHGRSR